MNKFTRNFNKINVENNSSSYIYSPNYGTGIAACRGVRVRRPPKTETRSAAGFIWTPNWALGGLMRLKNI